MSEQNIAAFRRMIEAYGRGDKAAFLAEMHPDAETVPTPEWPEPGPYVGEAAWDFYAQAQEVWGDTEPTVEQVEVRAAGDKVFVGVPRTMHPRGSEVPVDFVLYGAGTFRDGKLARLEWFLERDPALRAAGLAE